MRGRDRWDHRGSEQVEVSGQERMEEVRGGGRLDREGMRGLKILQCMMHCLCMFVCLCYLYC